MTPFTLIGLIDLDHPKIHLAKMDTTREPRRASTPAAPIHAFLLRNNYSFLLPLPRTKCRCGAAFLIQIKRACVPVSGAGAPATSVDLASSEKLRKSLHCRSSARKKSHTENGGRARVETHRRRQETSAGSVGCRERTLQRNAKSPPPNLEPDARTNGKTPQHRYPPPV